MDLCRGIGLDDLTESTQSPLSRRNARVDAGRHPGEDRRAEASRLALCDRRDRPTQDIRLQLDPFGLPLTPTRVADRRAEFGSAVEGFEVQAELQGDPLEDGTDEFLASRR